MNYSSDLIQNALWLVMDPWRIQTTLGKQDEHTKQQDYINEYFAELIAWRLESFNHKVISFPDYKHLDDESISRHFTGHRRCNTPQSVIDYCSEYDIDTIVYTGFHVGKCILNNSTGCINMKLLGFKTYMATDLSCVLRSPTADSYPFAEVIKRSAEHCQLI